MTDRRIVVVGASLGGLKALEELIAGLPPDFVTPVAMVLHRGSDSSDALLRALRRHTFLKLREPDDKEPIEPGHVYVAPAGYHLMVEDSAFSLSTQGPICHARPSIDVLFQTAADAFGRGVVAVVLTGANHDGADGACYVKAAGGYLIVQDPQTAECPVMPLAALSRASADQVMPVESIGGRLAGICGRSAANAPVT